MSKVYVALLWVTVAVVLYGIFAAIVAMRMLFTRREKRFSRMQDTHRETHLRVDKELADAEHSVESKSVSRKADTVRDFIYVDIARLYSLYSQVFAGLADQ